MRRTEIAALFLFLAAAAGCGSPQAVPVERADLEELTKLLEQVNKEIEEVAGASVPLSEHPRPDFERPDWKNLNGSWLFGFDPNNVGEGEAWSTAGSRPFPLNITVPFPWGSKLSGVGSDADIGWYGKALIVPKAWKGKRLFLCIGAADWHTTAWLNGRLLGRHQGGYTPFEFELTPHLSEDGVDRLVLRIDDTAHPFKLEGKQGYGAARGIWQTAYLEARAPIHLKRLHFVPDIDAGKVEVRSRISESAPEDLSLTLRFLNGGLPEATATVKKGETEARFEVAVPSARLWSPEDPFLYEVEASLAGPGGADRLKTYFGMRKISVTKLPGTDFPWIALNNKPFYFQMALDQAYHPDGFYTFPTDEFMREEILRSRRIGLNALRVHVKVEIPRKLYWADRLGLLIMADVPNSWGEPDERMRAEADFALRGMIERDFNHPSIWSWVVFNETWGLFSKGKVYAPETQAWVRSMYGLAKSLDPTRLVEDNSPCNNDHVETDLNTWHAYLPGYEWREKLDQISRDTAPGSAWNYAKGFAQDGDPNMNSECGNVWGYEGSTGDVDWSWDYHIMMNEFRRHPKICGWLYTEHHDVINEWNGYFRFDRSPKVTGLSQVVPGMSLRDLHGPFYIAPGSELCVAAKPGDTVRVPLWASFLAGSSPSPELVLRSSLTTWDGLGRRETQLLAARRIVFEPWMSKEIEPIDVTLPAKRGLSVLGLSLEDPTGAVLHRNFTTFLAGVDPVPRDEVLDVEGKKIRALRIAPASYKRAEWSQGQWNVLDGLKVNGAGSGFFEYRLPWPEGLDPAAVASASFRAELGAKQLFTKDRTDAQKQEGDFMRGKGTADPSLNPNSYPMTDAVRFPSAVRVRVNGEPLGVFDLDDDPADHRGILSWHSQKRDKKLREAGSYGSLVAVPITESALKAAAAAKEIVLRLEVDPALPGGLAIYGERFGRYPLDPTVLFVLK